MLRIKSQSLNDFTILIGSFCIEYIVSIATAQFVCSARIAKCAMLLLKHTVSISISFVFVLCDISGPIRLPQRQPPERKMCVCVFLPAFARRLKCSDQWYCAVVKYLSRAFLLSVLLILLLRWKIHCRNTIMIWLVFFLLCALLFQFHSHLVVIFFEKCACNVNWRFLQNAGQRRRKKQSYVIAQ